MLFFFYLQLFQSGDYFVLFARTLGFTIEAVMDLYTFVPLTRARTRGGGLMQPHEFSKIAAEPLVGSRWNFA